MNGISNRAILGLVVTAFIVGIAASLAIRAPGAASKRTAATGVASLDTIKWRLPVAFATNLPALGDGIVYVADVAKLSSGGQTSIEVFEPGKLVPAFSITDSVKDRKIEAGYTWLGYDQGKIPASPLLSAVPFGMEPWEFTAWWYEGGGDKLADELYGAHGVKPLLCGIMGPEAAGWFRNEVKSLDDLKGLKIRFAGLGGRVMQKLGASVTVLPGGEIFPALERGVIDATEFSMPAIDERLGFFKLVKNNYFPGWHQTFTALHLIVNKEIWDKLSPASRANLEVACTAGTLRTLSRGEAAQGKALAAFKDHGVGLRSLPEPLLRELSKANDDVLAEEAGKDEMFKKILSSQKAFSASYRPWKSLGYLPRSF
ncbi:MAG TPA: TRAP transporter substrate-binding protein [Burkholderiaceae bacterium]|nr:TRAP transporter substrate-binding protein [Burkholderiaceae bacterium]